MSFLNAFRDRRRVDLWANMAPIWPQLDPQNDPKWDPDREQNRSKNGAGGKVASETDFGSILDWFGIDFGPILGWFWADFGSSLGRVNLIFGPGVVSKLRWVLIYAWVDLLSIFDNLCAPLWVEPAIASESTCSYDPK